MSVRIRLLAFSPLPPLRAWFDVNPGQCPTIAELKVAICTRVKILRDAQVKPEQFVLVVDEWETLSDSTVEIIRDGEIVGIRLCPGVEYGCSEADGLQRKRKRTLEPESSSVSSSDFEDTTSSPSEDSSSSSDTGIAPRRQASFIRPETQRK
jgi:hypothetical protein